MSWGEEVWQRPNIAAFYCELEIEDIQVNANLRWSCEKQKYMQIIIQNYNDNIHEHENQTKYYHYSFNTTWNQAK